MRLQVKSFDGHDLWDSSYQAMVLNPSAMPDASPVFIETPLGDADYSGMFTRSARNVALSVQVRNYAERDALQAQLKAWFKPGTRGDLVATFAVDGKNYALPCVVQLGPVAEGGQRYTIILQSEATAWKATTADTDTWDLSGAGGTHTITVEGDDETRLSITLTPTSERPDGYKHQQLYQLVPPNGVTYGLRPWCITINTAALVSAGKMQSSCNDLRIWLGDQETRRWISGPNTSATKVWFNVDLDRGISLDLKTAVAASGDIDTLDFKVTATNKYRIGLLPREGIVYEGNEWFYYNGRMPAQCKLVIEQRGLFDTTEEAHSVGDTFYFLPEGIRAVYGNTAATDPANDDEFYDDTKPLFSLSSSDNSKWVWTASDLFYDPDHPNRPGGWKPTVQRFTTGTVSDAYWVKRNAESGNAAMGMLIGCWKQGPYWKPERAKVAWTFISVGGIEKITVTGEKYRNLSRWPDTLAAIQRSPDGRSWFTVFNEATPGSAATWTALTNDGVVNTISTATTRVRAIFRENLAQLANAYAEFEIQTCTVDFPAATIPSGTLLGELLNYPLDITFANNRTGDAIDLKYPMRRDKSMALDGEANTVKYNRANAHNALSLDDEGRWVWIRLLPGDNELEVTGDDVGLLGMALKWYRRRL